VLLGAFLPTTVPLVLSVTFAALRGHGPHAFGLVRVWGTIGYLLSVSAFPWFLHRAAPATAGGSSCAGRGPRRVAGSLGSGRCFSPPLRAPRRPLSSVPGCRVAARSPC